MRRRPLWRASRTALDKCCISAVHICHLCIYSVLTHFIVWVFILTNQTTWVGVLSRTEQDRFASLATLAAVPTILPLTKEQRASLSSSLDPLMCELLSSLHPAGSLELQPTECIGGEEIWLVDRVKSARNVALPTMREFPTGCALNFWTEANTHSNRCTAAFLTAPGHSHFLFWQETRCLCDLHPCTCASLCTVRQQEDIQTC